MQALLKLLTIIFELIQSNFDKRDATRHEAEIKAIQDDPAAEFINEFGGVREQSTKASLPGSKAGVAIDEH